MAAQYPSNLVSTTQLPTTRADSTQSQTNHVGDHNNLAFEMIAVEAELGTLPKGAYTDVKTRLEHTAGAERAVYEGLRDLGGTLLPIAWSFDPAAADSSLTVVMTAQRLTGFAFVLPKTRTATGVALHCTTAVAGSTGYNGAAVYSMDSSGNWNFVIDTGANAGTLFNTTGQNPQAFTAPTSLTAGTVYFAAIVTGLTGVAVKGLNSTSVNGLETVYFRNGGKAAVAARPNAQILAASLGVFTNVPLVWVY